MAYPSKRLLLFTAKLGYQTRSFEEAARKLNVQLIYVTDRCHQLDDPWGDQAIAVHFETPEVAAYTVMEAARGQIVGGILALGDRPAAAAAYAARGLAIRYNHPAAVEACRSKLRTKEIFRDAGLNVSWFKKLPIDPTPEPSLLGISYPCVLKPLSLSASQGVVRANNREEFLAAAARIRRLLQSPHLSVLAIFDKPDPLEGPYFEETIYVTPSRLPESVQRAIEKCARDSARALGLSHGPIHAEFRINEQGVWPIEVAPRPIGGLCARSLRFTFDGEFEPIGLEELLVRHALELPGWNSPREQIASGVMMIPVPRSGILEGCSGEEAARSISGITELTITARLHDAIAAWPEGASYLGFLFARGNTPKEVEQALREAHQKLSFKITPSLPVEHPAARRITNQGN